MGKTVPKVKSFINIDEAPNRPIWKGPQIDEMPDADGEHLLKTRYGRYVHLLEAMANQLSEQGAIAEWVSVVKLLMDYGHDTTKLKKPTEQKDPGPIQYSNLPDLSRMSDADIKSLALGSMAPKDPA
jgi:hypothetical protein